MVCDDAIYKTLRLNPTQSIQTNTNNIVTRQNIFLDKLCRSISVALKLYNLQKTQERGGL